MTASLANTAQAPSERPRCLKCEKPGEWHCLDCVRLFLASYHKTQPVGHRYESGRVFPYRAAKMNKAKFKKIVLATHAIDNAKSNFLFDQSRTNYNSQLQAEKEFWAFLLREGVWLTSEQGCFTALHPDDPRIEER